MGLIIVIAVIVVIYSLWDKSQAPRHEAERIKKRKEEAYEKELDKINTAIEWEAVKASFMYEPGNPTYLPSKVVKREWKKCDFCGEILAYNLEFCPKCGRNVPKDYTEFSE